jgi:gluconolactonase
LLLRRRLHSKRSCSSGLPKAQGAATAAVQQEVPVLSRQQVDQLLTTPDSVVFIDVRRADEVAAIGSLPVFLNIQASEIDRFLGYIPRERTIVTISNHAHRALTVAALLRDRGFTVAGAVGVEDYAAQGGTLYGKKFVTPAIAGVVAADTRIEVIREGFEGTEGPIALADGSIVFTENRADRLVRIAPDNSVSTYLEHTGGANALALRADGELLAVQTTRPGIARLQPESRVLAASYSGKPLNRPNDLALARTGSVYFSDPGAAPAAGTPRPHTSREDRPCTGSTLAAMSASSPTTSPVPTAWR